MGPRIVHAHKTMARAATSTLQRGATLSGAKAWAARLCGRRRCVSGPGHRAASRVAEFRAPAVGTFRDHVEEVPDRTEIIAGAEPLVGNPHDPRAVLSEHRNAGQPALLAAIAHIGCEIGALMRHHAE